MSNLTIKKTIEPLVACQSLAAKLLGVSRQTFAKWDREGLIKGHMLGGKMVYPFQAVKQLALTGKPSAVVFSFDEKSLASMDELRKSGRKFVEIVVRDMDTGMERIMLISEMSLAGRAE